MQEHIKLSAFRHAISPLLLACNLCCLLQQELNCSTENDVKSTGQARMHSESFITLTWKASPRTGGKLNIKYAINNNKKNSNQWSMTRHNSPISQFLFANVRWGDSKVINGRGSYAGHKERGEFRNSTSLKNISELRWKLAKPRVWVHHWIHTNLCFCLEVSRS